MKKRIPSIVISVLNLILVFVPWLTIGEKKYNTFGFVIQMFDQGIEKIIIESGFGNDMLAQYKLGVYISLVLFAIYVTGLVIYLVFMICGKLTRLNIFNGFIMVAMLAFSLQSESIASYSFKSQTVPK